MIGCSMTSPEGFDMGPRMPASWRTCSLEPRAPESAIMKIGLNSFPGAASSAFISFIMASETASVARCQMSMILLWRSPSVIAPWALWLSTSRTSLRALSTNPVFFDGIRMSSTPMEIPARVAAVKPSCLTMSRISTVRGSPRFTKQ